MAAVSARHPPHCLKTKGNHELVLRAVGIIVHFRQWYTFTPISMVIAVLMSSIMCAKNVSNPFVKLVVVSNVATLMIYYSFSYYDYSLAC